jgi:hypothetical protein
MEFEILELRYEYRRLANARRPERMYLDPDFSLTSLMLTIVALMEDG